MNFVKRTVVVRRSSCTKQFIERPIHSSWTPASYLLPNSSPPTYFGEIPIRPDDEPILVQNPSNDLHLPYDSGDLQGHLVIIGQQSVQLIKKHLLHGHCFWLRDASKGSFLGRCLTICQQHGSVTNHSIPPHRLLLIKPREGLADHSLDLF